MSLETLSITRKPVCSFKAPMISKLVNGEKKD